MHRIAVSRHYSDGLAAIMTDWTLLDVADANAVLDALEDAAARAAEEG